MEVTLKLFINKRNNEVLYAEAGKEFVDFLGHLLVLPVGVIVGLVGNPSTASSLGSLYNSFKNLNTNYFNFVGSKEVILNAPSIGSNPSLLGDSVSSAFKNLYVCKNVYSESCKKFVGLEDTPCPDCRKYPVSWATTAFGSQFCWEGGYVNSAASFMVMDDLAVMPLSTDTCVELLSSLNLNAGMDLERKVINVGKDQVIKLLRTLLHSKTVLTDTFLKD